MQKYLYNLIADMPSLSLQITQQLTREDKILNPIKFLQVLLESSQLLERIWYAMQDFLIDEGNFTPLVECRHEKDRTHF